MINQVKHLYLVCSAIVLGSLLSQPANADVLQVNGGLSTGYFISASNVTNKQPIVFLNADWSFDNGAFTGAGCYQSTADEGESLSRGCNAYVGYFSKINDTQAISVSAQYKRYLVQDSLFWSDLEAQIKWHINKNLNLALTLNDNWLDRGFATTTFEIDYSKRVAKDTTSYLSAGLMQFESSADIGLTEHVEFGLRYQKKRWSAELSALISDSDVNDLLWFDSSQSQVRLTFRYRLY